MAENFIILLYKERNMGTEDVKVHTFKFYSRSLVETETQAKKTLVQTKSL